MSPAPLSRERTPDRPGPGPLPEAFLRAVDLQIGRRLDGLLTGEHRTAALGMGTELAQIREWAPGDDVRRIDWNATARSNEVQVRVDVAERALTSWVLLDVSPSMRFGTADRRKWDVAEGVAVATGHLASRRGNRIGVATFGGSESLVLPPRQGRVGCSRSCSPYAASPRPSGSARRRSGALSRSSPRSRASGRWWSSCRTSAGLLTGAHRCWRSPRGTLS